MNLQKIIVPVDFSEPSLKALDVAQALAERFGASLHFVHIVEPTPFMTSLPELPIVMPDSDVAKHWDEMLTRLTRERAEGNIKTSSEVRLGKASDEIVAIAEKSGADMLVIATHGRTGLKRVLMGSTAERVVRHAPCPVLVVRERKGAEGAGTGGTAKLAQFRRILVPTDFSPLSQAALNYAGRFAEQFGAELVLLHCIYFPVNGLGVEYHIYDTAVVADAAMKAAESRMATLIRENVPQQVVTKYEVRTGPPIGEIPEYVSSIDADLVICATHGRTGLKRALLGSTAEGIVRHTPCSVLVVPEHRNQEVE
ncbi:universal stress protein [Verrucomicrobiota bacterium sgz303538]